MASAATVMAISAVASAGVGVYQATKKPPKIPTGPDKVFTGNVVPTGEAEKLDTTNDTTNKRATARKGTQAYKIPLESKTTGISASGSTGLKI